MFIHVWREICFRFDKANQFRHYIIEFLNKWLSFRHSNKWLIILIIIFCKISTGCMDVGCTIWILRSEKLLQLFESKRLPENVNCECHSLAALCSNEENLISDQNFAIRGNKENIRRYFSNVISRERRDATLSFRLDWFKDRTNRVTYRGYGTRIGSSRFDLLVLR